MPIGYSSKSSESGLWGLLKSHTVKLRDLHMCRVENSCEPGYPDVEGCWAKVYFNIELKTCARPARPETSLNLRHLTLEQCMWLKRRATVGGRAFLLVKVGSKAKSRFYLLSGISRLTEVQKGITEQRLAQLSMCQPDADYEQLMAAIVTWSPLRPLSQA